MDKNAELTEQQKQAWSSAASGWERWTDWFEKSSGDLSDWLCENAGVRPGARALDLACGGGEPSTTIAARVLPGGSVVSTDLSPDMVAATVRRAQRLGRTNLTGQVADAQDLPFEDASFDAVTCRFGIMFCPQPERAAAEIHRVLKPGGRFAVAVWDMPATNPFFMVLAGILAKYVEMPPPDAKAPGLFRLAPPGELENLFTGAGFSDLKIESRPMLWAYDSVDQYWQIQTDLAAPLRTAMKNMTPEEVERLKADVFVGLQPFTKDGRPELAAVPLCATGSK
ncbi:MAG: methyltransferase domain-containing protein [Thermoanaerobaculia bacterium]